MLTLFRRLATWRAKRNEKFWTEFERAISEADRWGMHIGEVVRIRQLARSGSKGWLRWAKTGEVDAIWIENFRLRKGQLLIVSGSYGHGPHHNETVFFVSRLHRTLPRRIFIGWRRHKAKFAARGPSSV